MNLIDLMSSLQGFIYGLAAVYGHITQAVKSQKLNCRHRNMSEFDKDEVLQENRPQDVLWLSLLSEKELDVLILLKSLVIERAKYVGHEHVANKYDLKMLRKLYCRIMKHLKGRIEDTPSISGTELLNGFNTSDMKGTNSSEIALLEEVIAPIMVKSRNGKNSSKATSNDASSISPSLIFALRRLRNSGF